MYILHALKQEKEERLEKMRMAWNKRKNNEEITVKTAKGEEFKFGGVSIG